jgi:hypothetical protein
MSSTSTPGKYPPHTSRQGIPPMSISKMGVGGGHAQPPRKRPGGAEGLRYPRWGESKRHKDPPGWGYATPTRAPPATCGQLQVDTGAQDCPAVPPPVLPPAPRAGPPALRAWLERRRNLEIIPLECVVISPLAALTW